MEVVNQRVRRAGSARGTNACSVRTPYLTDQAVSDVIQANRSRCINTPSTGGSQSHRTTNSSPRTADVIKGVRTQEGCLHRRLIVLFSETYIPIYSYAAAIYSNKNNGALSVTNVPFFIITLTHHHQHLCQLNKKRLFDTCGGECLFLVIAYCTLDSRITNTSCSPNLLHLSKPLII